MRIGREKARWLMVRYDGEGRCWWSLACCRDSKRIPPPKLFDVRRLKRAKRDCLRPQHSPPRLPPPPTLSFFSFSFSPCNDTLWKASPTKILLQIMPHFANDRAHSSALFIVTILLAKPTLYLLAESNAASKYLPSYSYIKDVTSQLGVAYEHRDPVTDAIVHSTDSRGMNVAIFTNGMLEMAAHWELVHLIGTGRFESTRRALAVMCFIGMTLLVLVPGGPKEREHWTIVFHGIGALLALGCGNLNPIMIGISAPATYPLYRWMSVLCGTSGLLGILGFALLSSKDTRGFWQRTSIYPKVIWEFFTAAKVILDLMY